MKRIVLAVVALLMVTLAMSAEKRTLKGFE